MKDKTPIIRLRRFKDMCCEFERSPIKNKWCGCIVNNIVPYLNTYLLYLSNDDLRNTLTCVNTYGEANYGMGLTFVKL